MQNFKEKFSNKTFEKLGTIQKCIRTNDLELVGDGTHLTSFDMVGNFCFGNENYEEICGMWAEILKTLNINSSVHIHPDSNHGKIWRGLGFDIVEDLECSWGDGEISGFCSEHYVGDLEIGNLVNPLGHSVDVGFGLERLVMVLEGKDRVDKTSLFDQDLPPLYRDHVKTMDCFWENGVTPGNKGRNYVCRRILRRIINIEKTYLWESWLENEKKLLEKSFKNAKKLLKRHKEKSDSWWWDTCGLTKEDVILLKENL